MKYIINVGEVSKLPKHICEFSCCDLEEVLEVITDLDTLGTCEYLLVVGKNVLRKANWSENGEPYGEIISSDIVVDEVYNVISELGLSNNALKIIIKEK